MSSTAALLSSMLPDAELATILDEDVFDTRVRELGLHNLTLELHPKPPKTPTTARTQRAPATATAAHHPVALPPPPAVATSLPSAAACFFAVAARRRRQ